MAKSLQDAAAQGDYSEMVSLTSVLLINAGISSATEHTMVSILGSPRLPLTTKDQPQKASDLVKKLKMSAKITDNISVEGIRPAVESLEHVLNEVFDRESGLKAVLGTDGMLNVRYRNPTSGRRAADGL
jgi:hypothetical protein